jgi:hypothetical protein
VLVLFTPGLRAGTYSFQTLNNNGDPAFNQLLGINNSGTIAGYFGDGSSNQPNKGYTFAPPYTQSSYTNENYPKSTQTQVIGINNNTLTVVSGRMPTATTSASSRMDRNTRMLSTRTPV